MEPAHTHDIARRYAGFARNEARHHSEVYADWAEQLSEDQQTIALLEQLPPDKRQPNIVFASARLAGALPGPYENLRRTLHENIEQVAGHAAIRSTQTNEAARLGVLLPLLAHLSRRHDGAPLALLELGASAGLCLWPDRWAYHYVDRDGAVLQEISSPHPVGTLQVTVKEALARGIDLPTQVPVVAHRVGLDLNPLDAGDPEDADWLRTLVWPGQDERLSRLDAALSAAAREPRPVVAGDLRDPASLDALLDQVPTGAVPVVFHTAVLAYLDQADRDRAEAALLARVHAGECHWVANEGQQVLTGIRERVAADAGFEASLRRGSFVVSLDGEPRYQADGHAEWILG
ncbi:DUF2332 domain-containing protein [Luteococcus peritonei]|uniref:DUF2332 domain-containing protein n=1 Tax=Luteococcus peritonei TaxID=88874 RepID=A0ABW4RTA4_9ACTN